jgi:plastocyanin
MRLFLPTVSAALACLFACIQPVLAADLSVAVTDAGGKPVASAVVTFTPAGGAAISAADRAGPFVMAQKNIRFQPYVLAVPVGSTVNFPNQDRVNHHVYSFSPVQPFQFPLYGKGQTRTLKFDHEGTVALACNIHDSMSAYVRVVATPYFATTDASGRVTLTGVPDASGTLAVWQPLLDAPEHTVSKVVNAAKGGAQTFAVKIKPAPLAASGAY